MSVQEAPDETPGESVAVGATYAVLAIGGALLGLVGSVVQAWPVGPEWLPALVTVLVTGGLVRLAGWATRTRAGAGVPAVLWTAVVVVLLWPRAEGDLIVPGTAPGYLFLFGGLLALTAAVVSVPPAPARQKGSWLTRGAPTAR